MAARPAASAGRSPAADLDRKNKDGHTDLRIHIAYEGESQPHSISLIKFDGQRSQIIEWESNHMSASMPTAGILALIKAA